MIQLSSITFAATIAFLNYIVLFARLFGDSFEIQEVDFLRFEKKSGLCEYPRIGRSRLTLSVRFGSKESRRDFSNSSGCCRVQRRKFPKN
jgi:hypothetical protein